MWAVDVFAEDGSPGVWSARFLLPKCRWGALSRTPPSVSWAEKAGGRCVCAEQREAWPWQVTTGHSADLKGEVEEAVASSS